VDVAETSTELATQLNQYFVQQLAEYAAAHNIWLVHFSTDYVFDGSGDSPWRETDECRPLQRYGRSKRAGELAILASGCQHLIFRTSWLYDSEGQNFLLTMLRLARQATTPLNIVADQIGAPTFAPALSAVVSQILGQLLNLPPAEAPLRSGIYHLCAQGHCSWFDFAAAIFTLAKAEGLLVELPLWYAISSAELTRPAARPKNSRLDTRKVQATFNLQLTNWQQQLAQCLELLKISAKTGK
jgi:dTDP-4-dehydrorhamnose reductase